MIDWTCSERRIDALAGHSETALRQLKLIRRAPGPVQDPDAVTKDDGLAPDRDFGAESIR